MELYVLTGSSLYRLTKEISMMPSLFMEGSMASSSTFTPYQSFICYVEFLWIPNSNIIMLHYAIPSTLNPPLVSLLCQVLWIPTSVETETPSHYFMPHTSHQKRTEFFNMFLTHLSNSEETHHIIWVFCSEIFTSIVLKLLEEARLLYS